jgi:hypothetical protein
MAPKVKTAKNSKLPKLSENCFEPVGKGGWPSISTWITITPLGTIPIFSVSDKSLPLFHQWKRYLSIWGYSP